MKYNYILKQEEIDSWFDCFVDELGVRDLAMHGWPSEDQCYLSTTKNPCNGPKVKQGTMSNPDAISIEHFKGSQKTYQKFYSNKTIAAMVAEIFKDDIFNFDYSFL